MKWSTRGADAALLFASLLSVAWFHPGGSWDQNARFAQVRSIVEDASPAIDPFIVYYREDEKHRLAHLLQRRPVGAGTFRRPEGHGDTVYAFAWTSPSGELVLVDPDAPTTSQPVPLERSAVSGAVAYVGDRFFPVAAPGASLVALPGYSLAFAVARAMDWSTDSWSFVTNSAWIATMLGIGLSTALSAVLVQRLARTIASEGAARAAGWTFALGTMAWPLGAVLTAANVAGLGLLAASFAIRSAVSEPQGSCAAWRWPLVAGFAAGWAALADYSLAIAVVAFALVLVAWSRRPRDLAWYVVGACVPLAAAAAYNAAAFGSPLATAASFQNPMLASRASSLAQALFSPEQGLFVTSPVMLAALAGLATMWTQRSMRPLALVVSVGALLVVVAGGGSGEIDDYIVPARFGPAIGLLAVALAPAFDRWRTATAVLAGASVVMQLLVTAVDPLLLVERFESDDPPTTKALASRPLSGYVIPLFLTGRPTPVLEESIDLKAGHLATLDRAEGLAEEVVAARVEARRRNFATAIERGDTKFVPIAGVDGPVAANPMGMTEAHAFVLGKPRHPHAVGNSFNAGEWLFPQSRWSLAPLLLFLAALGAAVFAGAFRSVDPRARR